MKLTSHIEKIASGILGAVCLLLLVNLVLDFGGVRAGGTRPTVSTGVPPTSRGQALSRRTLDDLSRYDPVVKLDVLEEFQSRPLPQFSRNPFALETPRAAARPGPEAAAPPPPSEPAGPAPVPLTALGFAEKAGGVREAYVSDGEDIYVVHEGDTFAKRFKVLKITPAFVEVEDEALRRTIQLPIAQ